jgi:restriction system protein
MIPDFQSIMLPYLKLLADGKPHKVSESRQQLVHEFRLTEQEIQEMLPSLRAPLFANRLGWAVTYLKQADVIESVSRAVYKITDNGLGILRENPTKLNIGYLKRFSGFKEWQEGFSGEATTAAEHIQEEHITQSPEELLEQNYQTLRSILAKELLEKVRVATPLFFEQVVIDLLLAMGYGGSRAEAASLTKKSGDEGIDGVIKEDRLGLDVIYVQAKRWEGTVGRPVVQGFVGSLVGKQAHKGVMITTSTFSKDAETYVTHIDKKIVLIDGEKLANLMIEHSVGVSESQRYVIKKIDADYFGEE